jgi:integrase
MAKAEKERAGEAPSGHVWDDAVIRWGETQFATLRPATVTRYKTSLAQLEPFFRGKPLANIGPAAINAYTAARLAKGTSPATVRRDLTVASRVMKVAKRAGWIAINPVPDEAEEIAERREAIHPVPLRSIARVVRAAPKGFAGLLRFLARTGCRQEEAAGLEWAAVDFARGEITFGRTKTRSPRVIEMSPAVRRDLLAIPRAPASSFVFRSRTGTRFNNVPGQFRALVARLEGLEHFRCHDLRHTFGIRWLKRGRPIWGLARHLGHSSVKTTERYVAWLVERPE